MSIQFTKRHKRVHDSLTDSLGDEKRGVSRERWVRTVLKRKETQAIEFSIIVFKSCNTKTQATKLGEFIFHKILVSSYHESWVSISMSSTGLHEGQKGALANYPGPETGSNLLVGPPRWDSLESATDSRNPKNNRQHRIDDHTPPQKLGCRVSGIDPIRSPFRTCSCPYCLVTSDYTWGCFHTHTCDWIEQLIASLYLILPDEIKQWCINFKGAGMASRGKASTNMKARA